MYDEIIKTVNLTTDEYDIIKELLLARLDNCVSLGEAIAVRSLLEKLDVNTD